MQPHFNTQPLARWRHYRITKWRVSKWHSCSYNSCGINCVARWFSLFHFSISRHCCLDGSSIHQPIFCCSSHSPDTCPHPVLHTSRSSAVRPTLQTLAPIQSSTPADLLLFVPLSRHLPSSRSPHPSPNMYLAFLCFFGLSRFRLVLGLISAVLCLFSYVRNNVCFLMKIKSVPDVLRVHRLWIRLFCVQSMTLGVIFHILLCFCPESMFHICMLAVGNMHVCIIRNFILTRCASLNFLLVSYLTFHCVCLYYPTLEILCFFSYVRNNVCFLMKIKSVPDVLRVHRLWIRLFCVQSMTLGVIFHILLCFCPESMFHICMLAVGNMHVCIIRNFILTRCASLNFLLVSYLTFHCVLQPDILTNMLEYSNIVFSLMFAMEMVLKVIAEGPFGYIKNGFNVFDGIIVIMR